MRYHWKTPFIRTNFHSKPYTATCDLTNFRVDKLIELPYMGAEPIYGRPQNFFQAHAVSTYEHVRNLHCKHSVKLYCSWFRKYQAAFIAEINQILNFMRNCLLGIKCKWRRQLMIQSWAWTTRIQPWRHRKAPDFLEKKSFMVYRFFLKMRKQL